MLPPDGQNLLSDSDFTPKMELILQPHEPPWYCHLVPFFMNLWHKLLNKRVVSCLVGLSLSICAHENGCSPHHSHPSCGGARACCLSSGEPLQSPLSSPSLRGTCPTTTARQSLPNTRGREGTGGRQAAAKVSNSKLPMLELVAKFREQDSTIQNERVCLPVDPVSQNFAIFSF